MSYGAFVPRSSLLGGLSPYAAMDYLWDGAGLVNTGGFATAWTAAKGGVNLSQVQANGCAYNANWRNGHNAITSTTGRLQSNATPLLTPAGSPVALCYCFAGQFPTSVANGAYKGMSTYSGKPFPLFLKGNASTVSLQSWENDGDQNTFKVDMTSWLGLPFFLVVRHQLSLYRMFVRVAGATWNLPWLSGVNVTPSVAQGWTMGGTADVNNMWNAPLSMGGAKSSPLTDDEMSSMCDWAAGAFAL